MRVTETETGEERERRMGGEKIKRKVRATMETGLTEGGFRRSMEIT